MRNTLIPLTQVGFISADGIARIEDMVPETDEYHYSTGAGDRCPELSLPHKVNAQKRTEAGARLLTGNVALIEAADRFVVVTR